MTLLKTAMTEKKLQFERSEDHGVSRTTEQAVSLSHCRKWRTNTERNLSKVILLIYTNTYLHPKHAITTWNNLL